MRYFVMEVETTADGTAKAVTEKATETEAKGLYHQILSSVYANPAITYALVSVMQDNGFALITETYPPVQPEEE